MEKGNNSVRCSFLCINVFVKTIMVGSDYQAVIPEGLCHYDDALPYENEDKLLWDPSRLDSKTIEDFLKRAASLMKPVIPMGAQLRDDEQALYLLQQCGHNVDEALRRIRISVIPSSDSMSLWSEEECRNFESGIRCFGKNFHLIQQNKVLRFHILFDYILLIINIYIPNKQNWAHFASLRYTYCCIYRLGRLLKT